MTVRLMRLACVAFVFLFWFCVVKSLYHVIHILGLL